MKRELMLALLGVTLLIPAAADAQRNRTRDADRDRVERLEPNRTRDANRGPVQRLEPIRANGRIRPIGSYGRRGFDNRSRVVYSSRGRHWNNRASRVWVRANWGRVHMEPIGFRGRQRELNRSDLRGILGRRTVDRIRDTGRSVGLRGAVRGHWVRGAGQGRVLVVTMDRVDVAQFADFNRDGFVDEVFLIRPGRGRQVAYGG